MNQKKINKTREEVEEILHLSRDKQEFVKALGYKDSRSAKKICERFNLNLSDLGIKCSNKRGRLLNNGERFGKLVVINANCDSDYRNETLSECRCDCGQIIKVKNDFLKRGHTQSCGCSVGRDKNNQIKEGQVFNGLTVLKPNIFLDSHGEQNSLCRCSCGKEIIIRNNCLRRGQISCGCMVSKGEYLLNHLLNQMNINFKTQYSFKDLIGEEKPLRFDFAIFKNNDEDNPILIEFQGQQHYKVGWGDEESFNKLQIYDQKKRDYCKEHSLKLIEICYKKISVGANR